MATLPVTFTAAPIPATFVGTPQQFLEAIAERLVLEAEDELTFFVTGSVAPTSNVGPWLKDGTTWYVWSDDAGEYIPEILDSKSLRYIVSLDEPDAADYTFWIEIDADGDPVAIKTYNDGNWIDVYAAKFANYSTTAEMETAIETEVSDATNSFPAAARIGAGQTVDVDEAGHIVQFETVVINPDDAYDGPTYRYTAPVTGIYFVTAHVQVENIDAVAAMLEIGLRLGVNGNFNQTTCYGGTSVESPPGSRWYPQFSGLISVAAGSYLEVDIVMGDGTNTGTVGLSNGDFNVHLVQRILV